MSWKQHAKVLRSGQEGPLHTLLYMDNHHLDNFLRLPKVLCRIHSPSRYLSPIRAPAHRITLYRLAAKHLHHRRMETLIEQNCLQHKNYCTSCVSLLRRGGPVYIYLVQMVWTFSPRTKDA